MIYAKAGDLLVHLGGAAAFMAVGLAGEVKRSRIALLAVGVALTGLTIAEYFRDEEGQDGKPIANELLLFY